MIVSSASNITTGNTGSPGTAARTKVTLGGTSTAGSATLNFNDGDGINENISVVLTGTISGSYSSPDADAIIAALSENTAINAKYIIGNFNKDEIIITQRTNTGDVTIAVTLDSAAPTLAVHSPFTVGVAAVPATKDKDQFTVTNVATSSGYIVIRISDSTGLGNTDVTVSGITTSDTQAQIATKIANALNTNLVIGAKYTVTASGDDVELETKSTGANSVTVSLQ